MEGFRQEIAGQARNDSKGAASKVAQRVRLRSNKRSGSSYAAIV